MSCRAEGRENSESGDDMPAPLVSIIMPARDSRLTIGLAISSVLSQSLADWELIIVDDGSIDGTSKIVNAYNDPRISVVNLDGRGAAAARNAGLGVAQGALIAFLDDDDWWFPDYLGFAVAQINGPRQFVTCNSWVAWPTGTTTGTYFKGSGVPSPALQSREILRRNFISIMSVFPREMLADVGPFDEGLLRCEDWDFWIRAILSGWQAVQQQVPLAVLNRTLPSQSSSVATVARFERMVRRRYLPFAISRSERLHLCRLSRSPTPEQIRLRLWRAAREWDYETVRGSAKLGFYVSVPKISRLRYALVFAFPRLISLARRCP